MAIEEVIDKLEPFRCRGSKHRRMFQLGITAQMERVSSPAALFVRLCSNGRECSGVVCSHDHKEGPCSLVPLCRGVEVLEFLDESKS